MQSEQKFISESIRAFLGKHDEKKLFKLFKSVNTLQLNNAILQQGLAGYFYYLYSNKVFDSCKLPSYMPDTWKKVSGKNLISNELNVEETLNIIHELDKNKIDYFCIKGIPLRRRFYPADYINSSVDIDLFIKKTDYKKTKDILIANGYNIPINYYINKIAIKIPFNDFEDQEYEICFIKEQEALQFVIDLQWDFLGRDRALVYHSNYNIEPFYNFDNVKTIKIAEYGIRIFAPEPEFINMAFHYAFHHGFNGIKWLTDICLFIKKYEMEIDFEYIFKTADENIKKILGITLMLAYDFNYQKKLSGKQKKMFCVDRLLPFEYKFYRSMVFKSGGIISDRTALRFVKILLPYRIIDSFRVIKDSLKFVLKKQFKK